MAALFFGAYNLALLFPWFQGQFSLDQGMFQQNLINAQEYALGRESYDIIVVGSSLAARLPASEIGPGTLDLAFAGGSVFTGLQLVAEHAVPPKIVVVETNIIMRGEDRDILANIHRPVVSQLRRYLPALHEKFAPSNLIAVWLRKILLRCGRALGRIASRGTVPGGDGVATTPGNSSSDPGAVALARELEIASIGPDPEELHSRVEDLRKWVAALRQRGIRCVFLEMPVHAALVNAARPAAVRSALRQAFPSSEERWLTAPSGTTYHPRDALHLSPDEAVEFAHYLHGQLAGSGTTIDLQSGL